MSTAYVTEISKKKCDRIKNHYIRQTNIKNVRRNERKGPKSMTKG